MKKFSKLIESVKYTEEDIEDFFLPLLDIGAKLKIYDGYYKPGTPETESVRRGSDHFYTSLSKIGPGYHDAKLVIISIPVSISSVDVEPWREIQNSSGFYFQSKQNFIKYRQIINEIYGCLSHIEYDYIIELEQDKIKLILIGSLIEETTSELSNKNKQMYDYLVEELLDLPEIFSSGSVYSAQPGKWYIDYDTQFYPSLRLGYKRSNQKLVNALASITKFNPRYDEFFQGAVKNALPEIVKIVKKIDDEGFQISWEIDGHRDNTYKILIKPKKS